MVPTLSAQLTSLTVGYDFSFPSILRAGVIKPGNASPQNKQINVQGMVETCHIT